MDFAQKLISSNKIKHGPIQILFTPDEEVGRGVDFLDMKKIEATFGYTLDGGPLGDIEDETFSADGIKVEISGVSAHPGYAKGKMVNAIKVASEIIDRLPKDSWSPETTEKRDGFVHPVSISGGLEKATLSFISRDHDTALLEAHGQRLEMIVQEVLQKNQGATYSFSQEEQYRNMKDVLVNYPFVTDYVEQAMKNVGITPRRAIIRGGTDGCRLSYMGVPCPNIFTGEMAIHSRQEYVSVQDMEKSVSTLWELVQIWEKHGTH
jgi:tripeptide aminopeptidase